MKRQMYSRHESFGVYVHHEDDASPRYISPFVVVVMGLTGQHLGVGRVIGGVNTRDDWRQAVIALDANYREGETIELLDEECHWEVLDRREHMNLLTDEADTAMSGLAYVYFLESQEYPQ